MADFGALLRTLKNNVQRDAQLLTGKRGLDDKDSLYARSVAAPQTLNPNEQAQVVDQFSPMAMASPLTRLPLLPGKKLTDMTQALKRMDAEDLEKLARSQKLLERTGRGAMPGGIGDEINTQAANINLDPGAGNSSLAKAFQKILDFYDQSKFKPVEPNIDIPNLLKKK